MRLDRFVQGKPRGTLTQLAISARLSFQLVRAAARDLRPIKIFEAAARLSDATGGVVSVEELCRPQLFNPDGTRASKPKRKRSAA